MATVTTVETMNKFAVNTRTHRVVICMCCGSAFIKPEMAAAGWEFVTDEVTQEYYRRLVRQGEYTYACYHEVLGYPEQEPMKLAA